MFFTTILFKYDLYFLNYKKFAFYVIVVFSYKNKLQQKN